MEKDILILGGGPAGLSTALHLQHLAPQLAPRLLVLEKEHYPRPKLCAGGLVADAEILLQRLGLDVSEIPHVDAAAAHFNFRGHGLTISMPGAHALRIIRRAEFDAWLVAQARARGLEIREGIWVREVLPDPDGVTVLTDAGNFRAQVVIGADGSKGITRRCVLPNDPLYTARVLEVLVSGHRSSSSAFAGAHRDHASDAYFDFFPVPSGLAGYTWDFPTQVRGQPMRCWGIYDANLFPGEKRPPLKELLTAEMRRYGLELADFDVQGHPIRWFDPFTRLSIPRVILVGDAAGVDSLFGEGISLALGYGKVAARELEAAFRTGDFGLAGYRQRIFLSPLGQTLLARWVIGQLIYSLRWAWFQFLLWQVFKPLVMVVAWLFVLNWAKRMR